MKLFWRVLLSLIVLAVPSARAIVLVGVEPLELTVDGVQRTALVYVPKTMLAGKLVPLVFVFHGHGGESAQAIGAGRKRSRSIRRD